MAIDLDEVMRRRVAEAASADAECRVAAVRVVTPVKTGFLRDSWSVEKDGGGLPVAFKNDAEYATYALNRVRSVILAALRGE